MRGQKLNNSFYEFAETILLVPRDYIPRIVALDRSGCSVGHMDLNQPKD